MIIYTKLPIKDIKYTDRPEFHGAEIKFKTTLMKSIKKYGIIDPIYAEVGNDYGRYIKVIVGNNRIAVAKELGIKEVPIIVNIYDPTFKLEGKELKTDDEIRALFKLGKDLQIRKDKEGNINQIMPPWYNKVEHEYV